MTFPRATLRIDLGALAANYRAFRDLTGVEVAASVKADAYGLGVEAVAERLFAEGCRAFLVATVEEGAGLRRIVGSEATIYVLNGPMGGMEACVAAGLVPVLSSPEMVAAWESRSGPCALMFDTGMNRLGLAADVELPDLNVALVMSHLACADTQAHPMNDEQRQRAEAVFERFPDTRKSLANSAGIYLGEAYHFDQVRPGIGLYGGSVTDAPDVEVTRPVVSLEAPVLQVREVKVGETVGYDATFTARRDMTVGVAGIGYADGLPVALSNAKGVAGFRGADVDIVGRVSMDLTCVDLTGHDAGVGEVVTFYGPRLAPAARAARTIDYELLTRCGSRLQRVYSR